MYVSIHCIVYSLILKMVEHVCSFLLHVFQEFIHTYLYIFVGVQYSLIVHVSRVHCTVYSLHITFMYTVYTFKERKHKIILKS